MLRKLLFSVLVAIPVFAQSYTGSISGNVTDSTGLPIPKVDVTITEEATNAVSKTVTSETGDFMVSYLKPGSYRVQFVAAGFKEHKESGVVLQISQERRLDPTLEVGQVNEVVQVSASVAALNLVSPEIGHVVNEEQLLNVPLIASNSRGRSPILLAQLVPGVSSTSYGNINNYSFGGGRPVTNEILVDGLPTTNPSDETYTLTPSPDSLQEFKVITTPFSAEWGHTGGGVMLATSKSGTNTLHGSVFDYFRNRVFNTRNFFAPNNLQKYVQNDPGGTLGGPVVIPKLYNGKDKTFFFADFNVTLAANGNVYSQLVPTDLQKAGDFSQTTAGGQLVPIYDPKTVHLGPDGKTNVRDVFGGNVIPANRIDSVAAQIVKFYPEPNGSFNGLNYSINPPTIRQTWQSIIRMDQNFSSDDKMFVRFGRYNPNSDAVLRIPNKANNSTAGGFRDTQVALGETHVFGPRVVNDFRVGFVQEVNYSVVPGGAAPELGLKGVSLFSFPVVNVSQMIGLGTGGNNSDRDRSWVFSEALTFQNGRHTLKIGGDYRRQMYNNYSPGTLAGSYSFNNTFTSSAPNDTKTGFSVADLLLGLPASTSININDYTFRLNINSAGLYFQDDFKLTRRLTLNLGLRWEYDGPYSEANGQFASFNPTLKNRTTGTPGEVEFAGRNGAPRHFSPNIYHDFLPRIGFAWNFASSTVLRGGYGIYRLPSIGYSGFGPVSQYGVNATVASLDNNVTPRYQLQNGVPAYAYNVDANGLPNIPASLTSPTSNVTELEPRARTPYNQSWQLGIQRQLHGNIIAEIDYVGNKGTKLPSLFTLNQLPASLWGKSSNPQSLRTFPQYLGVTLLGNDGNSTYHSLQASLNRRWTNGILALAYTWSKVINDVDLFTRANGVPTQDVYNLRAERGIAGYDTPHRFVASYVYRVPLGRGTKLLNATPVVKDVVRGWEVSGITQFQVGLPMTIGQNNGTGGFTGTQRANQVAPAALSRGERTIARWFNTNAFTVAPAFTTGNAPRFPLYGPGINNWDLGMMRNFPIKERVRLQFRAEMYNGFNHTQFSNPNTTIGNRNYGVITGANSARTSEFALRIFF